MGVLRRALSLIAVAALAGCSLPRDPDGTLDRVRGGTLRVGVTDNPPHSERELRLLRAFARDLEARVEVTEGAEHELVSDLERGRLDVVAGGLRNDTPWQKHVAMTRPYAGDRVLLAVPGENAFIVRLERHLEERR
jgi:polar amino acid transport system substrate-binding protein